MKNMTKIDCVIDENFNFVVVSEIAAVKQDKHANGTNYTIILKSGKEVVMKDNEDVSLWEQLLMHFIQ
jgi:hypothetical protein